MDKNTQAYSRHVLACAVAAHCLYNQVPFDDIPAPEGFTSLLGPQSYYLGEQNYQVFTIQTVHNLVMTVFETVRSLADGTMNEELFTSTEVARMLDLLQRWEDRKHLICNSMRSAGINEELEQELRALNLIQYSGDVGTKYKLVLLM